MAKSFTVNLSKTSWAVVTPGKSITLVSNNIDGKLEIPVLKERTFKIGEFAEYDSFNLSYFGPIKSITKKNVIVQHKFSKKTTRMPFATFHWRNINFDAAEAAASNSETMMYI